MDFMRGKLFSFMVRAEKVIGSEGVFKRCAYLLSENHENHVHAGTKIIKIHGNGINVAQNSSLKWSESNRVK